jgi:polyisoprenoid-binding protein YceI
MKKLALVGLCLLTFTLSTHASPRALVAGDSRIEFVVKEMGVPVTGRFTKFEAAIDIDPAKPERSSANMRIDVGSLTTGNDEADAIATGPDWLDKDHAQYAAFRSTTIRPLGQGKFEAHGTLTMRNKARDIVILFNSADQPGGKIRITSNFNIQRSEFGVGGGVWNQGGVVAESIPVTVWLVLAPASTPTGS